MQDLRTTLQRSYPRLDQTIKKYYKESLVVTPIFGQQRNVFELAFDILNFTDYVEVLNALNAVSRIVNVVIGELVAKGESWNGNVKNIEATSDRLKAFISYSGKTVALDALTRFLNDFGVEPVIAGNEPNLGRSIDVKVGECIDESQFVIILATGDSKDRNGNTIPAGNVLHEIGLAEAKPKFRGKIIYLLEEGAEFSSNIKPKGYIRFKRDSIERQFGDIVKEINEIKQK